MFDRPASSIAPAALFLLTACSSGTSGPAARTPPEAIGEPRTQFIEIYDLAAAGTPAPDAPSGLAALEALCWEFVIDASRDLSQRETVSLHAKFDNPDRIAGSDALYVVARDSKSAIARTADAVRDRLHRRAVRRPHVPGDAEYRQLEARCWGIRTEFHRRPGGGPEYTITVRFEDPELLTSRTTISRGRSFEDAAAAALDSID